MAKTDLSSPTEHHERPETLINHATKTYHGQLMQERDRRKLTEYEQYLKRHAARLRRLEREARGELVPGDYDGGYR